MVLKTVFQTIFQSLPDPMQRLLSKPPSPMSPIPTDDILLNSLSDVILMLDRTGKLQYVNAPWTSLTGWQNKHSLNKTLESFLHPEDVAIWSDSFQSLPNKKHALIWCRLLGSEEEIHWCEIRMQMMAASQNNFISATLCDITPQVRHDNIRQAGYRSLTAMVNRLPAIIYRARNNKNWSMEYVSDGCLSLTGYRAEQLINNTQHSFASLIHPEDSNTVWETVQAALQEQRAFDLHYRLMHANGSIIYVFEIGQGIYADTGDVLGVEGMIFKKVSEQSALTPLVYPHQGIHLSDKY